MTQARAAAQTAQGPAATAAAEGILGQALGRLFAVAEAYPELQADENFRQLQTELSETENRIAVSRQVYNDTVLTYNNSIQTFPGLALAGPFGFTKREFFETDETQREPPRVDFSPGAGPAAPSVPPATPAEPDTGGSSAPVARPRGALALAATVVAALTLTGVAQGQTYELVSSDVTATVRADGSVAVDEAITVAFSGSFTYGYREIPYRSGERIDEIGVSENGKSFGPGAPTDLEPGGPAGTFGVDDLGGRVRIVWRFQSDGVQQRTFLVHYRMTGLAVGYDDVVDVNLKVWGDEWKQRLGRLTATMRGPGDVVRAWGHPVWVRGDVTLQGNEALLRALDIDAGQFVELRALYPRDAFTSTAGMRVRDGNGLGEDRRRGAGGRASVRAGQGAHRRRDRPPVAQRADRARARRPPRARDRDVRVLALRPGARDRLRPRVRAGAADRHRRPRSCRRSSAREGRRARSSSRRPSST